ncbi:hypothetical protein V1519DRAFT_134730, partial [Lipomyces tetrasporus]
MVSYSFLCTLPYFLRGFLPLLDCPYMPVSAPPQAEATFDWIAMGLEDAYGGRSINTHYHLFQYVKMQHPDRQIISLDDPNFDVSGFLASQNVASDILAGEQVPKQHTVLTRSD